MRTNTVLTTKNLVICTLIGTVIFFLVDYLFYGILMRDFFTRDPAFHREWPDWPWLIAGLVTISCMLSYLVLYSYNPAESAARQGLRTGTAVGILVGFGLGFIAYATRTLEPLREIIIDAIYNTAEITIVAIIIAYFGRGGQGNPKPPDDDGTPPGGIGTATGGTDEDDR